MCGGVSSVGCSTDVATGVNERLWPPYEDLFDVAEEHCLTMLLEQWAVLCSMDMETFERVRHFYTHYYHNIVY